MSVIPLSTRGPYPTVVTTDEQFEAAGGRQGARLLIRSFDDLQLGPDTPNLSYDLRIGSEYHDHRDMWKKELQGNDQLTLYPGGAVIIETEESVHVPKGMFAYIVPRVKWLEQGVSNTLSKVDPGYNGKLLVTLFNLGKKTITFQRGERFCSLVVHQVLDGAQLYTKQGKRIRAGAAQKAWQRFRDFLEANSVMVTTGLMAVTTALVILQILQLLGILRTPVMNAIRPK